ncbi:hypothetical protein [Paenibacillus sp. 481]|uniref:hypothetical protein n=1 Tax=Paenibacillus sp. 481 TaxID=2835869 RepID=UPI001E44BD30|nr:hypothetical protein [Paenibacillus sp. 481]UHA72534.1 hypothetical protein KIK04_17975 [Paenibacillus sp. 481]
MLEKLLMEYITNSRNIISSEGLEGIFHYLEHGEYEMSFEGLVIELYSIGKYPIDFNFDKWRYTAISLGLDTESVFDDQFWNKFNDWGSAYSY